MVTVMKTSPIFEIPHVRLLGRFHPECARELGALPLFWACSGIELQFTGSALEVLLEADYGAKEPWISVEINGSPVIRMPVQRGESSVLLFQGMVAGTVKRVRLWKDTQPMGQDGDRRHYLRIRGLGWMGGAFLPLEEPKYRLEFIGDSLTSGEGLIGAKAEVDWTPALFSASRGWAKITADLMDAEFRLISQSGWGIRSSWDNVPYHALPDWYERVCGTAAGQENLAMGAQEIHDFSSWKPDAILINLGTNDAGAMGISAWHGPDGTRFKQEDTPQGRKLIEDAALAFLHKLHRLNPQAKLVWAYGMAGDTLRPQLEDAVERFCEETGSQDAYYLPLPAAVPETMGSRQHPGPVCHREAAEAAAAMLREILAMS